MSWNGLTRSRNHGIPPIRPQFIFIVIFAILSVLLLLGCEEDSPLAPSTGTIWIESTPEEISAPWSLAYEGDEVATGQGDSILYDMETGQYRITWNPVPGWLPPRYVLDRLNTGSPLRFSGVYEEDPTGGGAGTIVIDPEPEIVDAPWRLSGPDGYEKAWSGDATLEDLAPGEYTITWGFAADRITPRPESGILNVDDTMTFHGVYPEGIAPLGEYVSVPPESIAVPVTYTMGTAGDEGDMLPHQVTLTNRVLMAATEVTNAQYIEALNWAMDRGYVALDLGGHNLHVKVLDNMDGSDVVLLNLSSEPPESYDIHYSSGWFYTDDPDRPVGYVTWYGAAAFCDWLSIRRGLPRAYDHSDWSCNGGDPYLALGYRLPTEAEWELACRAGTTTLFNTGDQLDTAQANYSGTDNVDVASYPPNPWGLFDMHGNMNEWCYDNYGFFTGGDLVDPDGPEIDNNTPDDKTIRGGGYRSSALNCSSAQRWGEIGPRAAHNTFGFRPVLTNH